MKKKLISGILTGMFALTALIVGVYALIKSGMTFSGGICFNPNGVYVELSAQVYRGKNHECLEAVYDNPTYTLEKTSNYSETEGGAFQLGSPKMSFSRHSTDMFNTECHSKISLILT